MTIKQVGLIFWVLLLAGCTVKRESVQPQTNATPGPTIPKTVDPNVPTTGEWTQAKGGAGGYANYESFKNFQYNFDIDGNNQAVAIQLISDVIDVQYALFNPLGQQIDVQSKGRSVGSNNYMLNAGKYRIVVTADRQAVGKFSLSLIGTKAGVTLIPSNILQSGTQTWGSFGGGGPIKSTRNPTYTFDVTDDNTIVDMEIESADTNPALLLYDRLDAPIAFQAGARYLFQLKAAQKGTYTVIAGTTNRGDVGSFKMRIFGKVANLTQVQSVSSTASGNWATGTAFDTYSFEIVANNSPFDIDLTSPDIDVQINLLNSTGGELSKTCCPAKSASLSVEVLPKGTYQIMVQSYQSGSRRGSGSYTMNIFGRYTNFKKI